MKSCNNNNYNDNNNIIKIISNFKKPLLGVRQCTLLCNYEITEILNDSLDFFTNIIFIAII